MEIGDISLDFDGSVWDNLEEEEFSSSKKDSSLAPIVEPAMQFNGRYAVAAKTSNHPLLKTIDILGAGGTWNLSAGGSKDAEGNSKATVEASVGKETDGGARLSGNAGSSISSDKNQNIEAKGYGSITLEGKTESNIYYSGSVGASISTDGKPSIEASVNIGGDF